MKKIVALFIFIGVLLIILNGSEKPFNFRLFSKQPVPNLISISAKYSRSNNPTQIPSHSDVQVSNIRENLEIDPSQIWSNLEQIVGERYTQSDREFTRNYLLEYLQKFGFSTTTQSFEEGINIVAKRPSDAPNSSTLLIAAHYDTVMNSPGADDNASGIAVILEVARLFGKKPTANSLEIVFFDQEELGLLGSFAFTSRPENLQNIRHVIILDMVGYACRVEGCQQYPSGLNIEPLLQASGVISPDKGEFLVVVGEAKHRDLLAFFQGISSSSFNRILPAVVPLPIPFKGLLTPDVLRSDHAPFWYQNIAAVLVTDTANLRSPYYHQPSDTIANLDQEFLMGSAQAIINVVNQLLETKI